MPGELPGPLVRQVNAVDEAAVRQPVAGVDHADLVRPGQVVQEALQRPLVRGRRAAAPTLGRLRQEHQGGGDPLSPAQGQDLPEGLGGQALDAVGGEERPLGIEEAVQDLPGHVGVIGRGVRQGEPAPVVDLGPGRGGLVAQPQQRRQAVHQDLAIAPAGRQLPPAPAPPALGRVGRVPAEQMNVAGSQKGLVDHRLHLLAVEAQVDRPDLQEQDVGTDTLVEQAAEVHQLGQRRGAAAAEVEYQGSRCRGPVDGEQAGANAQPHPRAAEQEDQRAAGAFGLAAAQGRQAAVELRVAQEGPAVLQDAQQQGLAGEEADDPTQDGPPRWSLHDFLRRGRPRGRRL